MFRKILIANRGEIACRIIRTARRMGIATVAVYSDADSQSLHRRSADDAVRIGPPPAAESYLDQRAIIDACLRTGAEAVHPGYGFLSENPAFADALARAGIVFIGPDVAAIEVMGDKIASKRTAESAGVNVIPGHTEVVRDAAHARRLAAGIGYPVMLKASAGGGGKGMRVVFSESECEKAFERAGSEARSSFGDDRLLIEKFIENPRHIEIQVLADGRGNVLTLGERECSIQRRHQKVIEEAPSSFIDPDTRERMSAQAVKLARCVDYRSAGTVEFVVDRDRGFYFLEMNTRLQVEHPVTELVTGIDLVEEMIRVAAGEELSRAQEDIALSGWAVESRLYAEDPFRGFLPTTGRVTGYMPPVEGEGVRVDTGISAGSDIGVFYDPMIAKVITHADTRESAIDAMLAALDEFHVEGVLHNGRFLSSVLDHPRFRSGDLSTGFIEEEYPHGFTPVHTEANDRGALIAAAVFIDDVRTRRDWTVCGQVQSLPEVRSLTAVCVDRHYPVRSTSTEGGCDVEVEGRTYALRSTWCPGDPLLRCELNARPICLQVRADPDGYRLTHRGASEVVRVYSPSVAELSRHMIEAETPDLSRFLLSPMPGLLIGVKVREGQRVKPGEELVVVEAMKMENTLRAGREVVVSRVLVQPGAAVSVNQRLLEFE